jgi:hypothetical protein
MEETMPNGLEMSLSAAISQENLQIVAEMMVMRLPLRAAEQRRVARVRQLLAAEAELGRAVSAHTQHGLINCQGSHGAANLGDDTAALFRALVSYAALLGEVASEYRSLVRDAEQDLPLLRGFERSQPLQLS